MSTEERTLFVKGTGLIAMMIAVVVAAAAVAAAAVVRTSAQTGAMMVTTLTAGMTALLSTWAEGKMWGVATLWLRL